jgi:hypothetical protein
MSEKSESTPRTEEELKNLPTFEEYILKLLSQREDYISIKGDILFYALLTTLEKLRTCFHELAKDTGMFTTDSEEFKNQQRRWWSLYANLMFTRTYIGHYYRLPPPVWSGPDTNIMPERYYIGVQLSKEDFEKFWNFESTRTGRKEAGLVEKKMEEVGEFTTPAASLTSALGRTLKQDPQCSGKGTCNCSVCASRRTIIQRDIDQLSKKDSLERLYAEDEEETKDDFKTNSLQEETQHNN